MVIPEAFKSRMQVLLGEEYPAFIECLAARPDRALRINSLKKRGDAWQGKELPFRLASVPWASGGYYYEEDAQPGKHPFHEAGVYYIQEASAMAPAAYLQAQPGEKVLDLCAAPGGKSTQIAAAMQGEGLLVCNEIHPGRARILSENIERMGIANALVTNETPERLAERFPGYFERILVDAPCSGEGMFRKQEEAAAQWSVENVELCAKRQADILDCAARMLCPGGRLVYSTCTFAPQENEGSISRFLERHTEFTLLETKRTAGMASGVPEWTQNPAEGLERTVRLWPHRLRGEGHYAAVMQKEGRLPERLAAVETVRQDRSGIRKHGSAYEEFRKNYVSAGFSDRLLDFGEQLYLPPKPLPDLQKLRVLRPGLHLGTLKKDRFEPSHALALALGPQEVRLSRELSTKEAAAWVRGETLYQQEGEKGWYLMTVEGYSIGWGKLAGNMMKNHYPKGLRRNYGIY